MRRADTVVGRSDPRLPWIFLVRHGETAGPKGRFLGRSDPGLSAAGRRQMQALARALTPLRLCEVASSPLRRCRSVAGLLAAAHGAPLTLLSALRELDFGAWEGCGFDEVQAFDPVALRAFFDDPSGVRPARGECFDRFAARVRAGFACWRGSILGSGSTAARLLITHGGVIRVLLAGWRGLPASQLPRLQVPHGHVVRVLFPPGARRPLRLEELGPCGG